MSQDAKEAELKQIQALNRGFDTLLETVYNVRSSMERTLETSSTSHQLLDCWSMILSQDKSISDYLSDPTWQGVSRWKRSMEDETQILEAEKNALVAEKARILKLQSEKRALEEQKAKRLRDRETRLYGKRR